MFSQVKDDIGWIRFDLIDDHAGLVPNADRTDFVSEFLERADDMSFGGPIVGFQFLRKILIRRRRARGIEQNQNFVTFSYLNHRLGLFELPG